MEYDLIVIGSGPGGYVAAVRAAQLGGKVAVVERGELGGTCLNKGCIPTKSLVSSLNVLATVKRAKDFGIKTGESAVDFPAVMERKNKIVSRLRNGLAALFKSYGIDLIEGNGKIISPDQVQVTNTTHHSPLTTHHIIIATGSVPAQIPGVEIDGKSVITSVEALELEKVPSSLFIVGGGVIGVEFAGIFNRLGSQVTVIEMLPRIIPTQDEEISEQLERFLERQGIEIKTGCKILGVNRESDGLKIEIGRKQGKETLSVEKILMAVGRKPWTEGVGLEKIGVKVENGRIVVNDKMETNVPGVYAIGDVIGGDLLAHVASAEGIVAAENSFGKESKIDYKSVPTCIFTTPEVASVGLSEQKAEAFGYEVAIGKFPFAATARALILGENFGMVKIVADKKTDRILGVHIIGPEATDLIEEAALAIKLGATPAELSRIIHPHPTLSEAIFGAAGAVHNEAIDLRKPRIHTN